MTFDLVFFVDRSDAKMNLLVDALSAAGYRPRIPAPLREVDIVLTVPLSWAEIAQTAVTFDLDGVPVIVTGRSALRKMKMATGRETDRVDAEMLGDDDD